MPPPPPRLPKRQKTAPADVGVIAAAAGEPSHRPDSISIPPMHGGDGGRTRLVYPNGTTGCVGGKITDISPTTPMVQVDINEMEITNFAAATAESQSHAGAAGGDNNNNEAVIDNDDVFHDARSDDINDGRNEISAAESSLTASGVSTHESHCEDDGQQYDSFAKKNKQSPNAQIVNVSFRDIIGHGQAKLRLDEALLPLALPPDLANSVLSGIRSSPSSILLHGPPGTGKTKLAKAVAGEAQAAFLSVGPSDILSKFVGESEASIRGLFQDARAKARKMESKCCVVFFDEIDALGRSRTEDGGKMSQAGGDNSSRRVLAELLIQMTSLATDNEEAGSGEGEEYDGYCCDDGDSFTGRSTISTASNNPMQASTETAGTKPRVIVIAATNRPGDCDPALLRRFAVRVLVGLPSRKDRRKIVQRLLKDVDHDVTLSQLNDIALETDGWSGSDLESMTREAVMAPVRECLRAVAILKKKDNKAAKKKETGGADGTTGLDKEETATTATRESLLNNFRNLRPVSSKDFADGINFFLGSDQSDLSEFGFASKHAHYDSSSSSSEDED